MHLYAACGVIEAALKNSDQKSKHRQCCSDIHWGLVKIDDLRVGEQTPRQRLFCSWYWVFRQQLDLKWTSSETCHQGSRSQVCQWSLLHPWLLSDSFIHLHSFLHSLLHPVLHSLHCRRGNLQLSVPRWQRLSWPHSKWIRSENHDIFRHNF